MLKRPGMYFGTEDPNADALSPLLASWLLEAIESGARELSVSLREQGEIELRHADVESKRGFSRTFAASSSFFEELVDAGQVTTRFRPDTKAFPMLACRDEHRLVGCIRDAATAFPGTLVDLLDEAADLRLRVRYPRGCADRLLEEAGARRSNASFRVVGASGPVAYDAAFCWCDGPGLQVVALTNGERNANGGAHVYGVWEGIARALDPLLSEAASKPLDFTHTMLPRNAIVVVSVHVESPHFGPATKDCLHDARARHAICDAVARDFVAQLGDSRLRAEVPPWQPLGGVRLDTPWLPRFARYVSEGAFDGVVTVDPYAHHEGHDAKDIPDPDFAAALETSIARARDIAAKGASGDS